MASYKYNGLGRRVSRKTANDEIYYLPNQTKMYNNLLEMDGEEYVWYENNLLFRNEEAQIRDRLGSPVGEDEFGMASMPDTLGSQVICTTISSAHTFHRQHTRESCSKRL